MANLRAAYAEVVTTYVSEGTTGETNQKSVTLTSDTEGDWKSDATAKIGDKLYSELLAGDKALTSPVIVTVDSDGQVTIGDVVVQNQKSGD